MLADARAAPGTPGHAVLALLEPAPLVNLFKETPDGVIILIGHGVVGVVPVHPVAQADGLLRLDLRVLAHTLLAAINELFHAEGFNVPLGSKPQLALLLHLDPQPLAVEAVLVAEFVALHGMVTVENVFIGAAPGMVHTHGVIGGDRAVQEGPARPALVFN
ncbi:hypothetical protein ES703_123054 [subsurface metagenome]